MTLHVGLGTFAPIKVDDPAKHAIHREWCEVTQPTVDAIRAAKARGGRVVAVGTTTTRTLETAAGPGRARALSRRDGALHPPAIRVPGRRCAVTNFHLPRTTLLLLVGGVRRGRVAGARLRRGRRPRVPLLQLRRRHAGAVMKIVSRISRSFARRPRSQSSWSTSRSTARPTGPKSLGRAVGPRCPGVSTVEVAYPMSRSRNEWQPGVAAMRDSGAESVDVRDAIHLCR